MGIDNSKVEHIPKGGLVTMLVQKLKIDCGLVFLAALAILAAVPAHSADDVSGDKILSAMRQSNTSVSHFKGRFTITTVQYVYPDDLAELREDLKFYSEKLGKVSGSQAQKQVYQSAVRHKQREIDQLTRVGKIAKSKTREFSGIVTKDLKRINLRELGERDFIEYVSDGRDDLFVVSDARRKTSAVSSIGNEKNTVTLLRKELAIACKWAGGINHITNSPDIVESFLYENRPALRVKEDMGLLRAEHIVIPEYNHNSMHTTIFNAMSNERVLELKSQDWVKLTDNVWRPMTLIVSHYKEGKNRVDREEIIQFKEAPRVNQPIAAEAFKTTVPPDTTMADYFDDDFHLELTRTSTLKWMKLAIVECQGWRHLLSKWQKDN